MYSNKDNMCIVKAKAPTSKSKVQTKIKTNSYVSTLNLAKMEKIKQKASVQIVMIYQNSLLSVSD